MCMRTLLLSALFTFGVSFTGIVSASPMVGHANIKAVTKFSPRVLLQVTNECRVVTKCDKNGNNCQTHDVCR